MYGLSKKEYDSFKAICVKQGIKYETEQEYEQAANNLYEYVKLTYDLAREHRIWELRLKNEPQGFWLDSNGRTCYVCSTNVRGQIWFDKWGLKCANCQAAYKKRLFPGYVLTDTSQEKHITDSQLSWKYNLHTQTIKKLVREGLIKPRVIPNGPMIFLRKENPDLGSIIEKYRSQRQKRN